MAIQKTPGLIVKEIEGSENVTLEGLRSAVLDLARFVDLSMPKRAGRYTSTLNNNTQAFIKEYAEAYEGRYGTAPIMLGREVGIAKRMVKEVGLDRMIKLIKAFLQIGNDPWICAKKHSLATFEQNINAVCLFSETGKFSTFDELQAKSKVQAKKISQNF